MNYNIIDNFLEEKDFEHISSIFFPKDENQEKLPWSYNPGIVRNPDIGPTGYEKHDWMYCHSFLSVNNTEVKEKSEFIHLMNPIFKKLNASQIIIARANLLVPTEIHIHHEYHVDRKISHQVALFYITTNNGYTVLKDIAEVKCVKNRMLIFDGSILHRSVTSTDEVRCVVNINFIPYLKFGNLNASYK